MASGLVNEDEICTVAVSFNGSTKRGSLGGGNAITVERRDL